MITHSILLRLVVIVTCVIYPHWGCSCFITHKSFLNFISPCIFSFLQTQLLEIIQQRRQIISTGTLLLVCWYITMHLYIMLHETALLIVLVTSKCTIILLVTCPLLNSPNNGTVSCSLRDNGIPNPGETCSFTCNTGYQLIGSAIRSCQNNLRWSGNDAICISE